MTMSQPITQSTTAEPDELASLVSRLREPSCPNSGVVRLGTLDLEYMGSRPFASALDLIFRSRIYDVDRLKAPERILDGGGWLGLSTIRFRQLFPEAHITVFEPDPSIYAAMCQNFARNGIDNVEPVRAALAGATSTRTFRSTGTDAGSLDAAVNGQAIDVGTVRLSNYVDQPISLLKLNIEGTEAEVIAELGDNLSLIDQVLIEYHGFAELPQTLHQILAHLHEAGHTYIVSHFNERNRTCVPPLRLGNDFRYFLLIYARRLSRPGGRA